MTFTDRLKALQGHVHSDVVALMSELNMRLMVLEPPPPVEAVAPIEPPPPPPPVETTEPEVLATPHNVEVTDHAEGP